MCLMRDQFLWGHSSRVCDISCSMLQGMEEMSLEQFKNGGVNITGFQLLNQTTTLLTN